MGSNPSYKPLLQKKESKSRMKGLLFLGSFLFVAISFLAVQAAYSQGNLLNARIANVSDIDKDGLVKIFFSEPPVKETVEKGIAISPAVPAKMWWEGETVLFVKPNDPLKPETDFQITIKDAKSNWYSFPKTMVMDFSSPAVPKLVSVSPSDGEANVPSTQMITMQFDQPINNYMVDINLNPAIEFEPSFSQDKKELMIAMVGELLKDTDYTLKVSIRNSSHNDVNKILYEGKFHTEKPPVVVYNLDESGQPVKTEAWEGKIQPLIKDGKYIDINLTTQVLTIFENGKNKGSYKVSTGKRGMDTPTGNFKILSKARRPWSRRYGLYMPWFMGFTYQGHGIHELPEWPGGYKEGANHLGIPVSHGCVRLGVGPAKRVYEFSEVGTPLVVHK